MILVDSQPEWQEALSCCSSWPLKLYLHHEVVAKQPVKEEEDENEEEVPAFTVTPELFYSELGDEDPSIEEQRHLSETIPAIISQLAGRSGCLPGWVMESVAASQSQGDVLLDVNIPRFALALHSRALSLLVRADDEPQNAEKLDREAVQLLRHCVRLTPGDRNANFNLSCGLSRLGETDQALPPLEKYIVLGGDVKNIYDDADLLNVRKSAAFVEFEKRYPSPVVVEKEEPRAPEPEPQPEPSPSYEQELKVLSEFGIEEEMGRLLLEDCDGDVEEIMAAQFQSQFL